MTLEKGWFKEGEDKDKLEKIIEAEVKASISVHKMSDDKYQASQSVDDQELNNAAQAYFLGKNIDSINQEEAIKAELEIQPKDITEFNSNYITKN